MPKSMFLLLVLPSLSFAQECSIERAKQALDANNSVEYANQLNCLLSSDKDEHLTYAYPRIIQLYNRENRDSVEIIYQQALQVSKERNFNQETLDFIQTTYAIYLTEIGEYGQSLSIFQSLEDNIDNYSFGNLFYDQYAKLHYFLDDFDTALSLLKRSTKYCETDECLSVAYNNIGILHKNNSQLDSAIIYHERSLAISQQKNDSLSIAKSYNNIAITYFDFRYVNQAEKYFKLAYEANPTNPTSSLLTNYSKLLIEQNKMVDAEAFLLQALQKQINPDLKIEILNELVLLEELRGNYQSALRYNQQLQKVEAELITAEKVKEIERLRIEYETEKKEAEINLLNQTNQSQQAIIKRNQIIILFASILLLSLFALGGFYLYTKDVKAKINEIRLEQRLLRSQMNPHFIFNSLGAVQSFIIDDKPKEASSYLAKFSKLIRVILDNSTSSFVPLETEITAIEHYLKLQQLRFDSFDYQIYMDEELKLTDHFLIPPMLFQPFVENAIEHGLRSMPSGGLITIDFQLKNNSIECVIEDNGVGRRQSKLVSTSKPSLSTGITKERLKMLGKKQPNSLQIIDLYDENNKSAGTKVILHIPYKEV